MLLKKEDAVVLLIDVQEKLCPLVLDSQDFLSRCAWVLKLAERLEIPILVSEQYPRGLGQTVEPLRSFYKASHCVEKIHFSCMQSNDYCARLSSLHKKQLVLIGIEAHVCVLQSALDMLTAGYEVFVVVDAVSSRKDLDLKYALKRMKQEGVQLVTSEMVFFEWQREASSQFKALSQEFLKGERA